MKSDPITRAIIGNALAAAADEMSAAVYRTAYSTIVRDCLDYSTTLCDAGGEMIAQGITIPMQLGSVPAAMVTFFEHFGEDIHPGDVFVLNDPFDGGTHIPDIFILKPIFWAGQRIAFAISIAHHLDLGGRLPGSSACDNTEIYHDGFRIPWLRLYRRGVPDDTFFTLLRANVRVPEITVGDLRAQLAACHVGEQAILELIKRYGPETFATCARDLVAHTERLVRAEIATWPRGEYSFTDYLDTDGVGGPPVKIQVRVAVEDDGLTVDFTGSAEQVRGALNSTPSFVSAAVACCVRSAMQEYVPNNGGIFKPIRLITPPGTIVNPLMPAASSMRGLTGFRVVDAVFGALAQFLPARIFAAGEGGNSLVIIGGKHPDRRPYVYFELMSGTWGARPDRDGNDGLCNIANIASNIPIEQAECEYPVRLERYGLIRDSGGAGKFRGGLGIERAWQLLGDEAHLAIRSDRRLHRPYGLQGGKEGAPSNNILHHAGSETVLPTMISTTMHPGDRLHHYQPGGGGHGNPFERSPAAVARDVRNDKVSLEAARKLYGVVLDPVTFAVDETATNALRKH